MANRAVIRKMVRYMAWADDVILKNAARLPAEELTAQRDTLFGSIAGTLDHVLLIAEIFRAHLEGRAHPHTSRHRSETRAFDQVATELRAINTFYVDYADGLNTADLDETVSFTFVDGGDGAMTRQDILLHLVNHATYHRGFVSTLLYPHLARGQANDLTVFLRDAWPEMTKLDPTLSQ